jgi:uncharacterized RDD family membrane protein YckC
VRERFETTSGLVEVVFDEEARIVAAHRFAENGRAVAAAIESWDYVDFSNVLTRQLALSSEEADAITAHVASAAGARPAIRTFGPEARSPETQVAPEPAGLALRFVAVLLDTVIVLVPLSIVVGLFSGGGYSDTRGGSVNAGITLGGHAFLLLLLLGIGYYVVCESATGMTIGKRLVGICVIDEYGQHPSFGAAVIRNLLRLVDGFLFYLVGAVAAFMSPLGQRIGDRAAHTVVVRR